MSSAAKLPLFKDCFEIYRGEFLDNFCELELAVGRWLNLVQLKTAKNAAFGAKLESLASSEQVPAKAGKKQALHIKRLPLECANLMSLRNALVHHRRLFGTREDVECVLLQNIEDALNDFPRYIVITGDEISTAAQEVGKLAKRLNSWLNQASSPQPPSQAATADP